MRSFFSLSLTLSVLLGWGAAEAQAQTITTVAGDGTFGFAGDGGPATAAALNFPPGVAVDGAGNLFIADRDNQRIRRVSPQGTITTVAGGGNPADGLGDGGPATAASLANPHGVAVDGAGSIFIADTGNQRIRRAASGDLIKSPNDVYSAIRSAPADVLDLLEGPPGAAGAAGPAGPQGPQGIPGSLSLYPIRSVTAAYTADPATDAIILADATAGKVVVTLPAAAGTSGRAFTVKRTNGAGANVVVRPPGAETVDGGPREVLNTVNEFVTVVSDGAGWWVIGR